MEDFVTITKRRNRHHSEMKDHPIEGKVYNISEATKADLLGISTSWLQKDRCTEQPQIDFKRYGRTVRYSRD